MLGIRSGMNRVCLVAENEEAAKAISSKIEWLASHGSLLRMDAVCLGLSMDQRDSSVKRDSSVITPSQKRVPKGKKLRKQAMRKREAKLEKYTVGQNMKEREMSQRKRKKKEKKNWKDSVDPKVKS